MSVQEIEAAITQLPAEDLAELMALPREHAAWVWDKQIDHDLQAGRLDAVLEEVDREYAMGLARPVD